MERGEAHAGFLLHTYQRSDGRVGAWLLAAHQDCIESLPLS